MRSVLLAHSNHLYSDPKQIEKMQPYPPLQTMLAASVLREHGVAVHVFDPTFDCSDQRFESLVEKSRPELIVVCEDDFNFLSKMCLSQCRGLALRSAGIARGRGIPCVAHGSDASDHPIEYLSGGFDAVLAGEVEKTLLEICEGRPFEAVDGLIWRSATGVRRSNCRSPIADLDSLPAPAWDLINVEDYRDAWAQVHGYFSLNLAASRGCPYRCNWCAKPIHGSRYRTRSAKSVAAEMRYVKQTYRPDHIWFADDIFAASASWTDRFSREVTAVDASLPFKMQSRCDLMTRNNVAALRTAGCSEVWMGAESGSQRVLDSMDKDLEVEDIYNARNNLRRHGIRACFFLQFGYPGEEWADIEATIRMVHETMPDDIGISVSYPLPGTKFHQIVSGQIGAKTNWDNSADVSVIFRGAFSTEFYRAVADALHIDVRGGTEARVAWLRVEQLRDQQQKGVAA